MDARDSAEGANPAQRPLEGRLAAVTDRRSQGLECGRRLRHLRGQKGPATGPSPPYAAGVHARDQSGEIGESSGRPGLFVGPPDPKIVQQDLEVIDRRHQPSR